MKYDADYVKNVLRNLSEDPMRIIFTEHFLDQISKRNIKDIDIEELLENGNPAEINEVKDQQGRFELVFNLENLDEMHVLLRLFNSSSVILISAFVKKISAKHPPDSMPEFEYIYDLAFDLLDLHNVYGFGYDQTIEMEPGFNVDFDSCGNPVAVEVIRASKKFKLKREYLSSAKLKGEIEITPDLIKVRLKAYLNLYNINNRVIEKEAENTHDIPPGKFEFDAYGLK